MDRISPNIATWVVQLLKSGDRPLKGGWLLKNLVKLNECGVPLIEMAVVLNAIHAAHPKNATILFDATSKVRSRPDVRKLIAFLHGGNKDSFTLDEKERETADAWPIIKTLCDANGIKNQVVEDAVAGRTP